MYGGRIVFEKPDVESIGKTCTDTHCHTRYSDSFTRVDRALAVAERKNVGIAITDHNEIRGALEACSLDCGIPVIPGIEISALDGPHILMYFYSCGELEEYFKKNIEPYRPKCAWLGIRKNSEEIVDSAEGANCVLVAAHPYGYLSSVKGIGKGIEKGTVDGELPKRFDAYEVISGEMFRSYNMKAAEFAVKNGLGITAGTDAHLLNDIGNVVTVSESDTAEGILNDVKKGKTCAVGVEKNNFVKFRTSLASFARFSAHAPTSIGGKMEVARWNREARKK